MEPAARLPTGLVEIEELPAGKYLARVSPHGPTALAYAQGTLELELTAGTDRELDVRLRPGGSLLVAVSSASGTVPEWSAVDVRAGDGKPLPLRMPYERLLHFRGSVLIQGLPAENLRVRLQSYGQEAREIPVLVEPGRTSRIDVEYPDGG